MQMRGRTPKDLRILMREYAGHPGEQGTIAEYRMSCTRCVMREIDAIVIGSGISGLLSALALSREGKKVVILERESYIGGVCRSYDVNGYRVDTGPHAITRLENGPLKQLMDKYFNIAPQFIPFGKYYVRIGG